VWFYAFVANKLIPIVHSNLNKSAPSVHRPRDGEPLPLRRNQTVRPTPSSLSASSLPSSFLTRKISLHSFVFGAKTLCSTVTSRASALHVPFLRKLKSPKQNPLLVLQNWVDEGNDVSPSQLRSIARTLVRSKRYHHALEVPFSSAIYYTLSSQLLPILFFDFGAQF